MTHETLTATPPKRSVWTAPVAWLRSNPVLVKELRGRMRGNRAFILLTVYLATLALILGLTYLFLWLSTEAAPLTSPDTQQNIGKALFWLTIGLELVCVTFIAPALTAGAVSSERESQTYELLQTTLLPPRALVTGKLFSSLAYLLLLLFTAVPLQSIAFLFGGVAPEEVLINTLILVVTAFVFCAVGIFASSFSKRTLIATVLSYAFSIMAVFGVPMFATIFLGMFGVLLNTGRSNLSDLTEKILALAGWGLLSLNPVASIIATEVLLIEEQTAFLYDLPVGNGNTVPVLSPWITYVAISLLFSLILLLVSVLIIRRRAR